MALDRRQVTAHRLDADLKIIGEAERLRVKPTATRRAFAVLLSGLSSANTNAEMHNLALSVASVPLRSRLSADRLRQAWLDLLAFVARSTDSLLDEECAVIPNRMIRAMVASIQSHCLDVPDEAMLGVFNFWIRRQASWSKRRATNDGLSVAAVIAPLVGRSQPVVELGEASSDLAEMLAKLKAGRRNVFVFEPRKSAFYGMIRALAHGFSVTTLVARPRAKVAVTFLDLRNKGLRLSPRQVELRIRRGLEISQYGLFCLILTPIQTRFFSDLGRLGASTASTLRAAVTVPGTKGHFLYVFAPQGIPQSPHTALVIDGDAIAHLVGAEPSVDGAFATGMFAGSSLRQALSPAGPRPQPIVRKIGMRGVLGDLFAEKLRDLEGISRTVSVDRLIAVRDGDISDLLREGPPAERIVDARVKVLLNVRNRRPGSSCQYIIGNNGVGKSLLLRALADELVNGKIDTLAIAFTSPDRFRKIARELYRYCGLQAATADDRLVTIDERLLSTAALIHRSPERSSLLYEMLNLLGFRAECVVMARTDGNEGRISDIDIASSVIYLSGAPQEVLDRLIAIPEKRVTLGLSRTDEEQLIIPYAELSSGERQIVRLAVTLAGEVHPGTVVLVDEPEVSLHVAWQALLPRVIACLQAKIACHVVVATHSPLVISATGDGAICYSLSPDDMTEIPRNELRSVESALFDGFSTYTPRNRAVHEECAHIVAEAIRLTSDATEGRLAEFVEESVKRLGIAARTVTNGASMSPESASRDSELIERTTQALHEILSLDTKPDGP